jgi:hypothetical protein
MNDEFEGMWKEAVMALLRYSSVIYVEGQEKSRKFSVSSLDGDPEKIRTEHLQNTSLQRCHYIILFGLAIMSM